MPSEVFRIARGDTLDSKLAALEEMGLDGIFTRPELVALESLGEGPLAVLPLLGKESPRARRMELEVLTPGVSAVLGQKGVMRDVRMSNYLDFAEYFCERWQAANSDGNVMCWDEHGRRITTDEDIIALATRCAYDLMDTDDKTCLALRAIERCARKVDIREASCYIGFTNGVMDITNDTWYDDPKAKPTLYTVPHAYDPTHVVDHDGVMWKFLDKLSCHRDDVFELMCEVLGYSLMRWLGTREVPLLVSDGQHGKSTFLDVVTALVGDDNVCSKSVHELCERFGLNDLRGKALNIADDEDVSVFEPPVIRRVKIIGSHGRLFADRKGINGVTFRVSQGLIIASNSAPKMSIRDSNNGIWDRFVVVPFDENFSGVNNPDRDPDMAAKVTSEDALADALTLAVDAIRVIREHGWRLSQTHDGLAQARDMRKVSDNVLAWLDDEVEGLIGGTSLHGFVLPNVYDAYSRYCSRTNVKPLGSAAFSSHLKSVSDVTGYYRVRVKGRDDRPYVYLNDEHIPDFVYAFQFESGMGIPRDAAPVGVLRQDRFTGRYDAPVRPPHVDDALADGFDPVPKDAS